MNELARPSHPGLNRGALFLAAAIACLATPLAARADIKIWNVAAGNWATGGNWNPFGMPQVGDAVFIGSSNAAENATVTLNANPILASMSLTDGMRLDTASNQLTVTGSTTISGYNVIERPVPIGYPSTLDVENGPFATDCILSTTTVSDEGRLTVSNGATLRIDGTLLSEPGTSVSGHGTINLTTNQPIAFFRQGGLGADTEGLTLNLTGSGVLDLDGVVLGDNNLNVTLSKIDGSAFAWLTINGLELSDPMDEDVWVGENNVLTMNLTNGWELTSNSEVTFFNNGSFPGPAEINGGHLTSHADFAFGGTGAHGQINAPLTLAAGGSATLGPDDRFECNGNTVIEGGTYVLGLDANIDFDGSTTVHGGTFTTASTSIADGTVDFNGPTTWDGDIFVNGVARQIGDASVTGPSTISGNVFDFDGISGTTEWSIANVLTLDVDALETTPGNFFNGTLQLTGTFLGRLDVNLPPFFSWGMNGLLEVGGVGAIMITRVTGSLMIVMGTIDVTNRAQITANTNLNPQATVLFDSATARLRLSGASNIYSEVTFVGDGTLEIGSTGDMSIESGADFGGAGLLNAGNLHLGFSPGVVFVDRFEQQAGATWWLELGGPVPAFEHDQIQVTGTPTVVGGSLDVDLIDLGGGLFNPEDGDEFVIISAPSGSVSGAFDPVQPTIVPTKTYHWAVEYGADHVTLVVDHIVDCPADLNGDGVVSGGDITIVLGEWGPCPGCLADLNDDGVVDGGDITVILGLWGPCL